MLGINYNKIADSSCSTTTLRARRDEWIRLGIFTRLEATARDGYDKMVGPDLEHLLIDGCIVKASCGGEAAGRCSPAGRGKQGPKRSLLTDGAGLLGGAVARRTGTIFRCCAPPWSVSVVSISVWEQDHPRRSRATRALLAEFGCRGVISPRRTSLETGKRWPVERAYSWRNHGFKKLANCTECRIKVINALTNTTIINPPTPPPRLAHPPLGHPPHLKALNPTPIHVPS